MTDQETIIPTWDKTNATTPLAVLFVFGDDIAWIPKSQIINLDQEEKTLEIPLWLAEEKEIEGYEK